jgi:hypothetical protein
MVRDACTTLSEQMHQASLDTFNIAFGWVRSADEVVDLLHSGIGAAHLGAVENGIQYNKNHGQRVPVVSKMDLNWGKA